MDLVFAIAVSTHLGLSGDYNEIHPHVRLDMGMPIAGLYLNSENKVSTYLGLRYEYENFFIEGGAVTGYSYSSVVPYARIGYDFEHVTLFAAPAFEYEPEKKLGVVVGLEYRF